MVEVMVSGSWPSKKPLYHISGPRRASIVILVLIYRRFGGRFWRALNPYLMVSSQFEVKVIR